MNKSRIDKINQVLADYFERNQNISSVRAMDMMDEFVRAGIFRNDSVREGLPIRKLLRELYKTNQLDLIPYADFEQNQKNKNWYFVRID